MLIKNERNDNYEKAVMPASCYAYGIHTDSLCKNSGEGCSGSIRMESGNEDQITDDIDDTGNKNKQQR